MRAIDDCHQPLTKLAPTIRSVTVLIEVSLASSVRFVFSRHDTRFGDPTRFSFGMFFRPRIDFFSATNAFDSSISSSTRLTLSVAFSLRDASFRIHPCSLRPRTFLPLSRERERLSRPKTPSIDRAESVVRNGVTHPTADRDEFLVEGNSSPNAFLFFPVKGRAGAFSADDDLAILPPRSAFRRWFIQTANGSRSFGAFYGAFGSAQRLSPTGAGEPCARRRRLISATRFRFVGTPCD